jgi:hypothetical protein
LKQLLPILLLAGAVSAQTVPTDNPVATHYGWTQYPWTDDIFWGHVFNIADFPGSTLTGRFTAARNAASAVGGGVIYFPAGTYHFEDTIRLTNGIVLRGAAPTNGIFDARVAGFDPPSKLVFPQYNPTFTGSGTPNSTAFKRITVAAGDTDSNLGLVWLDVNRAAINLQGAMNSGRNRNIVVFGVRNNNVAEASPDVPASFQPAWSRYSYRFAANIRIQAYANVLVANNRLNDNITDNFNQPGYVVTNTTSGGLTTFTDGSRVPFHYGNHYGIVVNRSQSGGLNETPLTAPSLFRPGIVIRDNFVFHTMRVAIHAAGQGLIIRDNVVRDQSGKQWWTDPVGTRQASNSQTLENRAIDWAGWDVTITGNDYQVYRHLLNGGPYLSVDGEGILLQECCGGTQANGLTIARNTGNAYISLYKIPDIRDVLIVSNTVTDTGLGIYVNADPNGGAGEMFDTRIVSNQVTGPITARASGNGANVEVRGNTGAGGISASCFVLVTNNPGFTVSSCSPGSTGNLPPAVWITNPVANAQFYVGQTVPIGVVAADSDGTVTGTTIYTNGLAVAGTTLTNLPAGGYTVVARATDNAGAAQLSWPVQFQVVAPPVEAWRQQEFGPQAGNATVAGDQADPDGDGLRNLLEYALASDPMVAGVWSGVTVEHGYLTLTYTRVKAATDIQYWPEVTGSMAGPWEAAKTVVSITDLGATQVIKVRDHVPISDAGQRLIRLRVTR